MRLPLLEEIKGLLVTEEADPFGNNIVCLGYKNGNGTPPRERCSLHASNKDGRQIAAMVISFAALDEAPHEDGFYNDVKHFIELLHCTPRNWKESHAAAALRKFETWKHERTLAYSKAAEPAEAPASDEALVNVEKKADAALSQPDRVTPPRKTSKRDKYADAPVPESVSPSASTSSPGDESMFDLSVVSPADTNVTTPGSLLATGSPEPESTGRLPINYHRKPRNLSDLVEAVDDEDPDSPTRPDTPTRPPPRHQNKYSREWTLGTLLVRSATSAKERHKALRRAILQNFTATELKAGRVYIWKYNAGSKDPLIKVGFTERETAKRRKDAGVQKCNSKWTDQFWETEKETFVGARRVEKIMHKHLRECKIHLKICNECSIEHLEWFKKDPDEVWTVVEDWTRFVKVAYMGGKITEAARKAVDEWVVDMAPDVAGLAAFLESVAAEDSTPAAPAATGPAEQRTPDEVVVNTDSEATVLIESGKVTISAEPGALSVETDLAPHQAHHPIPEKPSTKPRWREKHLKQPIKAAARQMFSSHKPPRPGETASLPGRDGSSRRPDSIQGNENRVKQIFDKYVMKRFEPELRSLESETGTHTRNDDPGPQEGTASWMTRPKRTETFAEERGARERRIMSWMPSRLQRTATFAGVEDWQRPWRLT